MGTFRLASSGKSALKCVGPESARPFPWFKPKSPIRDEVAMTHHFIPFQTPKAFRTAGSRECFRFARSRRWFGCAVHHAFTVSPGGKPFSFMESFFEGMFDVPPDVLSPPNRVVERNIYQFRSRQRSFPAAFSFKSG